MPFSAEDFLTFLSLPTVGLSTLFLLSFISATLIPTASEPAVFAYIKLHPDMFWAAILVASAGNIAGGMVDWWLGYAAKLAVFRFRTQQTGPKKKPPKKKKFFNYLRMKKIRRYGSTILLLSWLPIIGDPLCIAAGWLRLPWQKCLLYMSIGKTARYIGMTFLLLWVPDHFWEMMWKKIAAVF